MLLRPIFVRVGSPLLSLTRLTTILNSREPIVTGKAIVWIGLAIIAGGFALFRASVPAEMVDVKYRFA